MSNLLWLASCSVAFYETLSVLHSKRPHRFPSISVSKPVLAHFHFIWECELHPTSKLCVRWTKMNCINMWSANSTSSHLRFATWCHPHFRLCHNAWFALCSVFHSKTIAGNKKHKYAFGHWRLCVISAYHLQSEGNPHERNILLIGERALRSH